MRLQSQGLGEPPGNHLRRVWKNAAAQTMNATSAPDRIALFRVTCWRGCFLPRCIPAQADQQAMIAQGADLRARRCKACGDKVAAEAIWADRAGRVPAGAPHDVPGRRQP